VDDGGAGDLRAARRRGKRRGQAGPGGSAGPADSWRQAFLRAPYLRETFVAMGIISETFETAITWERFPSSTAR